MDAFSGLSGLVGWSSQKRWYLNASPVAGVAHRFRALGIIRVRDGEIVSYQDYIDPIAAARLLGRTADLAAALANA